MKERYEKPELEVILLAAEDVITTSGCQWEGPDDDNF